MPKGRGCCGSKIIVDENGEKRKVRNNLPYENTYRKVELIDFLIDNIKEPALLYTDKAIDDAFDISEDFDVDLPKICFAILNYGYGIKNSTVNSFEMFAPVIIEYVPRKFRDIKFNRHTDWNHASQMYKDAIERFQCWILMMQAKIENKISEEYYIQGRLKNLEILKRRFKQNWSESKVVDLTADETVKVSPDSKLEIKITDV